jgi:hypothetical protein
MAYHLSTKAATPPVSSNITSWSNKESSSEDVNLFRILNKVSKMSLDGTSSKQQQQQECETSPPPPPPSSSSSSSPSLELSSSPPPPSIAKLYSCSTPDRFSTASNNITRTSTLHVRRCMFTTPPPLVAKTKIKQQRESSLPPPTSSTSTSVPIGIFLGRRKRQRCDRKGPPPMLPGSPEFDNTADTNPFGRHIAIHSPIAGVGNTLNLEFIAKIKLEPHPRQQQQHKISSSASFYTSSSASSSSSSSTSVSSPSSEDKMMIDRIQKFFPILDDDTEDGGDGNNEQGGRRLRIGEMGEKNELIIGIKTRALKMRRRCYNDKNCDIFEPTAHLQYK